MYMGSSRHIQLIFSLSSAYRQLIFCFLSAPLQLSFRCRTLQCRQPVFRCLAADITQPGWHTWETNYDANPNDAGLVVDWQGELWAQTRVP